MKGSTPILGLVSDSGASWFPDVPEQYQSALKPLAGKRAWMEVKKWSPRRNLDQNAAWWALVIPAFSKCFGYFPWQKDEAHSKLMEILRPIVVVDKNGKEHTVGESSSEMDTAQFAVLYKDAQDFMATEYEEVVPDPDPAKKKKRRPKKNDES